MNTNLYKPRFLVVVGIVFLAALVRFFPHPPNFVPIAALALFSGKYFSNKIIAFAVPILAMLLTDAIIGFHYLIPAVYISFIMIVGIGFVLRKNNKLSWIIGGSLAASTLFFIVTNFYVWAFGIMYPGSLNGLITCYVAAIPFYFSSLVGDLFYVGVMFMSFEFLTQKFHSLAEA